MYIYFCSLVHTTTTNKEIKEKKIHKQLVVGLWNNDNNNYNNKSNDKYKILLKWVFNVNKYDISTRRHTIKTKAKYEI